AAKARAISSPMPEPPAVTITFAFIMDLPRSRPVSTIFRRGRAAASVCSARSAGVRGGKICYKGGRDRSTGRREGISALALYLVSLLAGMALGLRANVRPL